MNIFINLISNITVLSGLANLWKIYIHNYICNMLSYSVLFDLASEPVIREHRDRWLWELNDSPSIIFIIHYQEQQLVYVVAHPVVERSHLIERFNDRQVCILIVYRVMEFNVELHRDHIAVWFLNEHCHFVIDDVRLSGFVVAVHKLWVLLPDQSRHEVLYTASLNFIWGPAQEHSKIVVALNDLAELGPVGVNYDEIG